MNIAFYAPLKPPCHPVPSGDRKMARQLFKALQTAGHDVVLASDLRMHSSTPHDDALLDRARREGASLIERYEHGGAARPDVWFTYHPYYKAPDAMGPQVCRHLGIAYVTAEASYAGKRDRDDWRRSQELVVEAIRLARVNFCFTPADVEGLSRITDASRIVQLAPFIDTGAPVPPKRRSGLHAPVRLVCVAMMRPGVKVQSYRFLAAALARLTSLDWRLDIIGDGPSAAEVRQALAGLGRQRLRFGGELEPDALRAVLADSDIFVWPGFGEAYGLAYLEAQAAGLPVVALDTHGVPSVVRDRGTGLLVKEAEPDAFAAAIARIAGDPALHRKLSSAARRFVGSERSLETAASILARHLAPFAETHEGP